MTKLPLVFDIMWDFRRFQAVDQLLPVSNFSHFATADLRRIVSGMNGLTISLENLETVILLGWTAEQLWSRLTRRTDREYYSRVARRAKELLQEIFPVGRLHFTGVMEQRV